MATFPLYAKLLRAGYSEEPDYGVLRTEMDGGIAKQYARRSMPIVAREAQIKVSNKADKLAFDEWAKTDLKGGAGWFTWTDPISGQSKQARIVGGKYQWTSPGRIWVAACQIETIG